MRTSTPLYFDPSRDICPLHFSAKPVSWFFFSSSHHHSTMLNWTRVLVLNGSWCTRTLQLCRAVGINIIIWMSYFTYTNLSTLVSSCDVRRRLWSTKVTTINSIIVWSRERTLLRILGNARSRWNVCYEFQRICWCMWEVLCYWGISPLWGRFDLPY